MMQTEIDRDLTTGSVTGTILRFAGPMILGNLLQQCYTIADTLIVGKYIGIDALAAVGSTYTLVTFLTSIMIGLCMGSGAVFSMCYGAKQQQKLHESVVVSFLINGSITLLIQMLALSLLSPTLRLLNTPSDVWELVRQYYRIILLGIFFVFLYNHFTFLLRALGNSFIPLCFLGIAAAVNILLDLAFIICFHWGIQGAAFATILSQGISGMGLAAYTWVKKPELRPGRHPLRILRSSIRGKTHLEILHYALSACVQQSVMNFGILMIQGLVNRFGTMVMAAFAAAVKIDSFAYMPAQEFGNAFSLFISQNHGAGNRSRIRQGTKNAMALSMAFCAVISVIVFVTAPALMTIFIDPAETEIIRIGSRYLRIEGACYWGIGLLFLLYGYYRGIGKPSMSLILTVLSLGTRVALAYLLAPIPQIGVIGIWSSIPIGWCLADAVGLAVMIRRARE